MVTPQGAIRADTVVLAAGMWSRQIGAKIGVPVPLQAMEHYYLLTEPMEGVHRDLPVVEDPESYAYVREEGGGLLFGLFEPDGAPWHPTSIPTDASFSTLPPDWDRMTPHLEHAFRRFPAMQSAGLKTFFCGPESFTPDGKFLVGECPEVQGLFLGTGLNSLGILSGGGVGALPRLRLGLGDDLVGAVLGVLGVSNHVGDERTHGAAHGIGFARVVGGHKSHCAGVVFHLDQRVLRQCQGTEGALDVDQAAVDSHFDPCGYGDWLFSNT